MPSHSPLASFRRVSPGQSGARLSMAKNPIAPSTSVAGLAKRKRDARSAVAAVDSVGAPAVGASRTASGAGRSILPETANAEPKHITHARAGISTDNRFRTTGLIALSSLCLSASKQVWAASLARSISPATSPGLSRAKAKPPTTPATRPESPLFYSPSTRQAKT